MSVIKLRGIVLNEIKKGEADKQLTLFTLEEGKVTLYARGARKLKSRYFSGSAQFDYSDFIVFFSGSFYSVTQIDKIADFSGIALDYDKLLYGNLFLELVDKTTFPGEANPEILKLLLIALKALEKGITDNVCVAQAFLFKYLQICGYEPTIECCASCGKDDASPLKSYGPDGLLCASCAKHCLACTDINQDAIKAIHYILNADIREAFSYTLDEISKRYLAKASDVSLSNFNVSLNSKKLLCQ